MTWRLDVWRLRAKKETLYREQFQGTELQMEHRLSYLWNMHTPPNGEGWTARAYESDTRKRRHTIGW